MSEKRTKVSYIGAPAVFALELALQQVCAAFGEGACYHVGSSLERPDWRDVDVRMILDDEKFKREFPNVHPGAWELDPKWLLLTVSISAWLSKASGLPIDFQIQPMTHANERHKGRRSAAGMRLKPLVGDEE